MNSKFVPIPNSGRDTPHFVCDLHADNLSAQKLTSLQVKVHGIFLLHYKYKVLLFYFLLVLFTF